MAKVLDHYIEINPEILNGTPVISGTRIPVERLAQLIKQGESLESLQDGYPWVEKTKIQKAIAYLVEAGLDVFEKKKKV